MELRWATEFPNLEGHGKETRGKDIEEEEVLEALDSSVLYLSQPALAKF